MASFSVVYISLSPSPGNRSLRSVRASSSSSQRTCLRCGTLYAPDANNPTACAYHAYANGERGLFAMAPPHQGIDGEWTDESGVIVYKWNKEGNRPNTGRKNWKCRWTCCGMYDVDAPPCRRGWHASYDDGATLF